MFTKYAIVENGEVVQYPVNPRVWVVSEGAYNVPDYWTGGELDGKTYVFCHNNEPRHTPLQSLRETNPVKDQETGNWYRHYDVIPATPEEIDTRIHSFMLGAEAEQAYQLEKLQGLAVKIAALPAAEQEKWAAYKTALQSIPEQTNYPFEIVWPTPPNLEAAPNIDVERI